MNIRVLNTDLIAVKTVDTYKSFIWTDRYNEYGDFQLYLSMNTELLEYLKQDYYLTIKDSDHVMIIETLEINSDVEEGNHLTVTGRSLESILDRRIIWEQQIIQGNLQDGIHELLKLCIIEPSINERKIDNFIFKASDDPAITELTIDAQYTGDNLYDVIKTLCGDNDIGFKVTLNEENQFVFELYVGADRTYDQTENPYVIFSPKFENIVNSNYIESKAALKNVTLIGGEGEGSARRYATEGSASGLNRREIFTDASDVSSDAGDDTTLSEEDYTAQLKQRGKETLAENIIVTSFEGEVETTILYRYREDFFDGDIIQIANEYGHSGKARILEIVMSDSEEGYFINPTFSSIEKEGE